MATVPAIWLYRTTQDSIRRYNYILAVKIIMFVCINILSTFIFCLQCKCTQVKIFKLCILIN